jgi:general secretion pathway protein D
MRGSGARRLALAVLLAALATGCATKWAYKHGNDEAKKGNWDMAVAHFSKAVEKDPDSVKYRLALERARVEASIAHYEKARDHIGADELDQAVEELEIATKYDQGNDKAAESLRVIKARIRKREEEKRRAADIEQTKVRAKSRTVVPVLSPRSQVPLTLKFPDASLEKVFETLSKLSGVNILFDEGFKDKPKVNVSLNDVTFQEALDQLTFTNRLFYKVLDGKTLLIIPDTAQKRRTYEDVLVRTFYLENADPAETMTLVKNLTGVTKAAVNPSLAAITILGTFDELAMAEKVIVSNDKPKGEVVVEVKILEVNRDLLKQYGLALSRYEASVEFSPTGNDTSGGLTTVRAQLLSSLNLSDFVVSIPSTITANFLQTDGNTRLLAAPKLRAAEGKKTSLVLGSQVPVPTTTFQSTGGVAGQVFSPTTSFQYRDVGVKLDLTPKITATGQISLEMAVEFSDLGPEVEFAQGQRQPTFLTRSVTGILRLEDGESTLLGGLINRRETRTKRGAVGISDIPLLGDILSNRSNRTQETEILISITPRLVRGPELTEDDLAALYVGSKENIRVPSARPPLFGPEPEEAKADENAGAAGAAAGAPATRDVGPSGAPSPVAPAPQAAPSPPAPQVSPSPPAPGPATPPGPGAASGAATAGPPVQARAMVTPARPRMAVGETKNLDLLISGPVRATSVDVVLVYDPKVLEATAINPGSLLTLDGVAVDADRRLEPGRVAATFRRASAAAGSGVVASVTFHAIQPGQTPVSVESVKLVSETGEQLVPAGAVARVVVGQAEERQEVKP